MRVGFVSLLLLIASPWPHAALAHPSAWSSFDARTDGRSVVFTFRLDATSMVDLVRRTQPHRGPVEKSELGLHADLVLSYLEQRFTLFNAEVGCLLDHASPHAFHTESDKLVVEARFRCSSDLDRVRIDSTLFHDEDTPHELIGTFRHRFAVERYFFSRGERVATIDVTKLRQAGPVAPPISTGFRMAAPPPGAFAAALAPARPVNRGVLVFLLEGVRHILGGPDHILFVLSLLLAVENRRRLALVITSFTLAHSVTLALSALDLFSLSPRVVEPLIALSVLCVAMENLVCSAPRARLGVTFGFGLVHGLGFGQTLAELGLSPAELAFPLLGFNLGVELGQLALVAPLGPILFWLQRRNGAILARQGASAAMALVAWVWFVERVFGP